MFLRGRASIAERCAVAASESDLAGGHEPPATTGDGGSGHLSSHAGHAVDGVVGHEGQAGHFGHEVTADETASVTIFLVSTTGHDGHVGQRDAAALATERT